MKKYFTQLFIVMILAVPAFADAASTSISIPVSSANASLSISDSASSHSVGDVFDINIILNTSGESVQGVDIVYLNYDPSYFEVQDADSGTSGVQITAGSLMANTVANSVSAGRILFSQASSGSSSYSGSGVLATIKFKVLKAGNTSLTFDLTSGSTTDTNVAQDGKDILGSASGKTYTLNAASNSNNNSSSNNGSDSSSAGSSDNSSSPSSTSSSGSPAAAPAATSSNTQSQTPSNTGSLNNGDIVKLNGDPKIYLIENGNRKHIPSAEEFNRRGFSWGSIKTVSASVFDQYAEVSYDNTTGATTANTAANQSTTSSGVVMQVVGDPRVYLIEDGKRKHIPSADEFNKKGLKWSDIKTVSSAELNKYAEVDYYTGSALASAGETLVKFSDSPNVYVLVDGKNGIVHIPTYESFVSAGFDFSQVQNKNASERSKFKVLLLVKADAPEVYYLDPNKRVRKHITSPEVFNSYASNKWEDISVIPQKYLSMYKDASLVQVAGSPDVYFVDENVKRRIPSPEVFAQNNFEWQDIMVINSFEMNSYLLSDPLTGNVNSL